MRTALLIGFGLTWGTLSAQTVLPNWLIDSMAYEVRLGRQCTEVMKAQAVELEAQGKLLMHTNTALDLKNSETQTLEGLLDNAKKGNEVLGMQFALDKKKLQRKVRKRNLLILGESVVIVLLISTL